MALGLQTRLATSSASSDTSEAACLVQALLLALRAEETPVPQLSQYAGALHLGLEPPQQLLTVLTVTKRYERQIPLLGPHSDPVCRRPARCVCAGGSIAWRKMGPQGVRLIDASQLGTVPSITPSNVKDRGHQRHPAPSGGYEGYTESGKGTSGRVSVPARFCL